jgi:predicted PurR-regulated permease PerM
VPPPNAAPEVRPFEPSPRTVLRIVLIVVLVVAALYVIYLLRRPISWIVIAGFVAVAVSGPINLLSRHMKRGFAIAIAYVGLVLLPVALLAILLPPLVSELDELIDQAPQYAADVSRFVENNGTLSDLEQKYDLTGKLEDEAKELPSRIGDAAGVVRDLGVGIINSIFAAVTILILSVFMVGGGRRWIKGLLELQPPERAQRLRRAFERIANAVGNYVGGALLQALMAGVATFLVLTILGVPFAAPLAVLVALLDLIPLVGATLGAIIVGIVTLFNDFPTVTIIWIVWAIVYQQLENNLVQPQIQRRAVQLEPIVVLISVLFGSALFGILGALLAIPIAASAQIAVREYLAFRREGADDGEEPPPPSPAEPAGEGAA